jgi:hypothetical protein
MPLKILVSTELLSNTLFIGIIGSIIGAVIYGAILFRWKWMYFKIIAWFARRNGKNTVNLALDANLSFTSELFLEDVIKHLNEWMKSKDPVADTTRGKIRFKGHELMISNSNTLEDVGDEENDGQITCDHIMVKWKIENVKLKDIRNYTLDFRELLNIDLPNDSGLPLKPREYLGAMRCNVQGEPQMINKLNIKKMELACGERTMTVNGSNVHMLTDFKGEEVESFLVQLSYLFIEVRG